MIIGVPKEIKQNEKRVSLLPHLVKSINKLGHKVIIQSGAGEESGVSDSAYIKEGAEIASSINGKIIVSFWIAGLHSMHL